MSPSFCSNLLELGRYPYVDALGKIASAHVPKIDCSSMDYKSSGVILLVHSLGSLFHAPLFPPSCAISESTPMPRPRPSTMKAGRMIEPRPPPPNIASTTPHPLHYKSGATTEQVQCTLHCMTLHCIQAVSVSSRQ